MENIEVEPVAFHVVNTVCSFYGKILHALPHITHDSFIQKEPRSPHWVENDSNFKVCSPPRSCTNKALHLANLDSLAFFEMNHSIIDNTS